ncbi:MAG: UDP-N-acetylmuramoyl-L-alanyl-D-glutamate--2,6-diaminopimelate ligase, partial [Clostridia bacterium]|nr:UDP-N-acetylmuramoyl-L-alanyl-D-glutamate--2,6-diaminopimelate ligase [Clostridia bacterium]
MKKLQDVLAGVAVTAEQADITALVCDSRKVVPGCAFVCIDGVAVDGHTFAAAALEAGAAALIVQRDLGLPHQVIVEDTRLAWALMSANWFGRP